MPLRGSTKYSLRVFFKGFRFCLSVVKMTYYVSLERKWKFENRSRQGLQRRTYNKDFDVSVVDQGVRGLRSGPGGGVSPPNPRGAGYSVVDNAPNPLGVSGSDDALGLSGGARGRSRWARAHVVDSRPPPSSPPVNLITAQEDLM